MLTYKDIAHKAHTDIETVKEIAKRTHRVGKVWRVDDDPDRLAGSSTKWEAITRYIQKQNSREHEQSADNVKPQVKAKQKPEQKTAAKPVVTEQKPEPIAKRKPGVTTEQIAEQKPKREPVAKPKREPDATTQVIPEVPPKVNTEAHVVKVSESVIPALVIFRDLPGMGDVSRHDVRKVRDSRGRKVAYVVRTAGSVRILWRDWYTHDDVSLDATVRALAESWAKAA